MTSAIERVAAALDDIRQGKMVILVDDEDRENEGDVCMAAEMADAETINFMARLRSWAHLPEPDRGPHPPARAPP